jgi:hypothetical protein
MGLRESNYDRARNLVIDPALAYASYLGGSGKEFARSAAADSAATYTSQAPQPPPIWP